MAVGFVLHMGDALDLLVADLFGDLLDHRGLVHLVWDLVDDDGPAILADLFHVLLASDDNGTAPLKVGFARAGPAQHDTPCGKVGTGNIFDQILDREVRIIDQRQRRVTNLAEVMRRDVRRHANGDTPGAIDQHVRETRRQNNRFAVLAVVVQLEIDGVLVDILQQVACRLGHPHFGISKRRRLVPVHGAKVALTVEQGQGHRKALRHSHQRVVNRGITMRVILAHGVRDGARGFTIALVVSVSDLVHGIKDTPVHRF